MSGRPEIRCLLAALALALLLACGAEVQTGTVPADSLSEHDSEIPIETGADLLTQAYHPSTIDLSGCWRLLTNSGLGRGSSFSFYEVGHNSFIFASETRNPRTKLVFRDQHHFEEVNFDPLKPFFPPEYIHSSGTLSGDGNSLERVFADGNHPHRYRRCHLVRELAPGQLPDIAPPLPPFPDQAPQPVPQITPLMPPSEGSDSDLDTPIAPLQPAPATEPEASALPVPLRPTPRPLRQPIFEQLAPPDEAASEET